MTILNSETLAPWQRAFIEHYASGDLAHLTEGPGNEFEARLTDCGDSFLRAALIELDPNEDCNSDEEAIRRLERVAREFMDMARTIQRNPPV